MIAAGLRPVQSIAGGKLSLHTAPRPHVTAPGQGQPRILSDGARLLLQVARNAAAWLS